jgi:FKBP-type peptidyl-prolyl cis-trans isomerase FkpA
MKTATTMISLLAVGISATACSTSGGSRPLVTFADSASYAVGQGLGQSIKDRHVEIEADIAMQGLQDALEGREPQLALEEIGPLMQRLSREGMAKWNEEQGLRNEVEGEAYLAENAGRDGVQVTESGIQYEVITEGTGAKPTATDQVTVHYVGTMIDGSVFDSSRERGEPATFSLDGVIPGWTEGLQLMSVGSTYRLVIPADLAYGEAGNPRLGPNATLIFEVELLGIE